MKQLAMAVLGTLVILCSPASAAYTWVWNQNPAPIEDEENHLYITENNGSNAVALGEYYLNETPPDTGWRTWMSVAARREGANVKLVAYEFKDWDYDAEAQHFPDDIYSANEPTFGCVTASDWHKVWVWVDDEEEPYHCRGKSDALVEQSPGCLYDFNNLTEPAPHDCEDQTFATAFFRGVNNYYACVMFSDHYVDPVSEEDMYALRWAVSDINGDSWSDHGPLFGEYTVAEGTSCPSLAVSNANGTDVYCVCDDPVMGIVFTKSTNHGDEWGATSELLCPEGACQPCIAAVDSFVFACFLSYGKVRYKFSPNGGSTWYPAGAPDSISYFNDEAGYDQVNVAAVTCGNHPAVVVVCKRTDQNHSVVTTAFGRYVPWSPENDMLWIYEQPISPEFTGAGDRDLHPSVAAFSPANQVPSPRGLSVYGYPSSPYRSLSTRLGAWDDVPTSNAGTGLGTGRLVASDATGTVHYAAVNWPHVVSGPIEDGLLPLLVGPGNLPALALDGDGNRWVSYLRSDTLWAMLGDGSYKAVFAGDSTTAIPGQPSICCPSNKVSGRYQAHVVFALYDTAQGASRILYAKLDTGNLALDTIAVNTSGLTESLPCVSSDTSGHIFVTWQDGAAVKEASLTYTPTSWSPPDTWSTPTVLATSGARHPMSVLDNEGGILHAVWSEEASDTFVVHHATCAVGGGMFAGWQTAANPSDSTADTLDGAVYAGAGVTCWQQLVAGIWQIRAKVRDSVVTLVDLDTMSVYNPHAVAESSAVSPSIDQLRVHLLYTAGVTFEVDSGVYDTGEVRYVCDSLNTSHAGSDATKANNGCKLLRKSLNDSLFCVYSDHDGAVIYARSADGDSWRREVMAQGRDLPAIAADSSGRRWVVVHRVNQTTATVTQEAYWRISTGWSSPQTLYTNPQNRALGPASLAGASDTSSAIAYAAFFVTGASPALNSIVVVKFNGTTKSTVTLATGSKVTAPTLTVEPYKPDTDRIHLAWEDNGEIKYSMTKDARTSSISGTWAVPINLSNSNKPSLHPCIAADRHQVVLAWAEGDTADIYSRRRSTDSAYTNWESSANLSNTAGKVSEYPTIAMGDSVIVAWEEHRSTTDYDILISVNFTDTLNIADNSTKSSYPHVLFQTKDSTPYVHLVWCESPQTNYYEVQYNKCNLRLAGEGQQSAGKVPVPIRPSLAACRPNPFRDRTQIAYSLPIAGNVSLRVYDVTGRTVRTLQNGFQKPGAYSVNWDSKDSRGRLVPHGVYFYRLDTPGFRDVKKAVVAR